MNDPVNHHYVTVFYLKRWAGDDRNVCRFSRPHGDQVVSKRVSPKGTAYEEHLYSTRTPNGAPIPDMERDFMAPLDSEAAEALLLLEQGLPETQWEKRLRTAWSRFLWTQLIRTPSEIAQLKSLFKDAWSEIIPGLQEAYEEKRTKGIPERVDDWLATLNPQTEDRIALTIARQLMAHSGVSQVIDQMRWKVLNFEGCGISLLTSDRPVWMTTKLAGHDAFILMPIGPTRLFVAASNSTTMSRVTSQNRRQLAKAVNKTTVQHAAKFVFGVDDHMKAFVQKHFASLRLASHMERLAAMRGHRIVDEDSPLA